MPDPTHLWTIEAYKNLETYQITYVRKCIACGIANKIVFDEAFLYHNLMTPQRLYEGFAKIKVEECPKKDKEMIYPLVTGGAFVQKKPEAPWKPEGQSPLPTLESILPGLGTQLMPPCHCPQRPNPSSVSNVIIHLNDSHAWTREDIADWLETLDVDLSFPTPERE